MNDKKRLNSYEDLPLVLDVADIQRIMGISRASAYELVHTPGYDAKVGRCRHTQVLFADVFSLALDHGVERLARSRHGLRIARLLRPLPGLSLCIYPYTDHLIIISEKMQKAASPIS